MSRLLVTPRTLAAIAALSVVGPSSLAPAEPSAAEANYNRLCLACHTIGGGRRVGPDLKGVNDRRSQEWLLKWIASSQAMVQRGDPTAVALFEEYKVPMPDAALSAEEIRGVLDFIRGGGQPAAGAAAAVPARVVTAEDIRRGQGLFQGTVRLANSGPACNSCHHVKNDAVIGGGVLAKDLTAVFTRVGGPGIHAILGTPPFPVMEAAYKEYPIKDDEVFALVGFLQDADQHQAFQQPRDFGFKLFYSGLAGLLPLMGLYALIWRRRRTRPVNHRVFDRQLTSRDD